MPLPVFDSTIQQLAEEHRQWLKAFDSQYVVNWDRMLRNDDEGAMTEASVRRMLQHQGASVAPNESLSGNCGGPDFRCVVKGEHFYVEVTCVLASVADNHRRATNLGGGVQSVAPFAMTETIFRECQNKASQCSGLDGPALVAIGTWNTVAAMSGFHKVHLQSVLTGRTSMTWNVSTQTGSQVGDQQLSTELNAAAFIRPDRANGVGFARNSISGLLLLNCSAQRVIGLLHPNPVRPFRPSLLPKIEFGRVTVDQASGILEVDWQGGIV